MKKWFVCSVLVISGVTLCVLLAIILVYYIFNSNNGELISSGEKREYLIYIPESYNPSKPSPMVISLHAAYLSPGSQKRITGWNALADTEGFIVVYPQAKGFPRTWRGLSGGVELEREIRFFNDLIDEVKGNFNLDAARIYINGFSNGAAMTFELSCALSERIAAFGMVALPASSWEKCKNPDPSSVIIFQGTSDPLIPYQGGDNFLTKRPLPEFEEWFAGWGKRNYCNPLPENSVPTFSVTLTKYMHCVEGIDTFLYTLEGVGHIWPGGLRFAGDATGPYTDNINATDTMWDFFITHPRVLTRRD